MCLPVIRLHKPASVLFRRLLVVIGFALFPLTALTAFAQTTAPAAPVTAASKPATNKNTASLATKATPPVSASKPLWADLTPPQQQSLRPLAATWNVISEPQKRKWLEISKNYAALSLTEQTTMHSRMNEWVAMSPQQRAVARLNFAKTKELSKQLTPDEKKAKWETYQALSPEEKARLAAKASPKPTGAATAVKPVPPQKLAVTPKGILPLPKVPQGASVTTTGETVLGVVTPPGTSN